MGKLQDRRSEDCVCGVCRHEGGHGMSFLKWGTANQAGMPYASVDII